MTTMTKRELALVPGLVGIICLIGGAEAFQVAAPWSSRVPASRIQEGFSGVAGSRASSSQRRRRKVLSPCGQIEKDNLFCRSGNQRLASGLAENDMTDLELLQGQPTELPDSLEDAALMAAQSCQQLLMSNGGTSTLCRVDVDTRAGDETLTLLKASTEFMQQFVSALSYAIIPGLLQQRQEEMTRVAQARAEIIQMTNDASDDDEEEQEESEEMAARRAELIQIVSNNGKLSDDVWDGPKVRLYFPDEGNAALARRDWMPTGLIPSCVEFSACGARACDHVSRDMVAIFFCPQAAESDSVEMLMQRMDETATDMALTVFVNPNLVDMGVTGFGLAGRWLRERLIDQLVQTYYLNSAAWGALTLAWPRYYTIWWEDETVLPDGYRQIGDPTPSKPDLDGVEILYEQLQNGLSPDSLDFDNIRTTERQSSGRFLDAVAEFVDGLSKI